MKIHILLLLLFAVLSALGQTSLTKTYTNPTQINSSEGCNFNEYLYNNSNASNSINVESERLIISEASSYFSFIVPTTSEARVKIKLDNNDNFGLALYKKENSTEYSFITYNVFSDTNEGQISIIPDQELSGSEIVCRFWKIDKNDQGRIFICINSEEIPTVEHRNNKSININTEFTPEQLVDKLITGCLKYSNVQFTGSLVLHKESIGYFSNGTTSGTSPVIGISDGVILSTGRVKSARGPNQFPFLGTKLDIPGNSILNSIAGNDTFDATVLEFDFVPSSNSIQFEYVFASEEYPTYVGKEFNDIFAFVVSGGPENYVNKNIAIIPTTTNTPVSINNVNHNINSNFYIANYSANALGMVPGSGGANTEYNGFTTVLTAHCVVTPCQSYNIKLMIADVEDDKVDSAVFLKSDSFTSGEAFTSEAHNLWGDDISIYRGCSNYLKFSRMPGSDLNTPIIVKYTKSGDAIEGVDYSHIPDSAIIGINSEFVLVPFDAIDNGEASDSQPVELKMYLTSGCPCDPETSELVITIYPALDPDPSFTNSGPICVGEEATINLDLSSLPTDLITATWQTGETNVSSITVSPTTTTEYYVDFTYPCGTKRITTSVVVTPIPVVNLGADFVVNGGLSTTLTTNLAPGNTGIWTETNNTPGLIIQNPTSPTTLVTVPGVGQYEFTWTETSSEADCSDSDNIIVTFNHEPVIDFVSTSPNCFQDNIIVTFTGETISANPIFNWDFGTAIVISGTGSGPYEILFPTAGSHNISLSVTEYGLTISKELTVEVPSKLELELITTDAKCSDSDDGTAKIIASGGTTPYTYKWSTDSENEEISVAAGTYHATITDANNCTENITAIISAPEVLKLTNNGDFTICKGETANITITSSGGVAPIKYYWSTDGTNFNLGESSLSEAPTQTTTYTIYAEDQNNCISNQILSKVTINPGIEINVNLEHNSCKDQCIGKASLDISGGQEPFNFSWESNSPILTDLCAGNYNLIVTDNLNCSKTIDFTIEEPEAKIIVETITTDAKCSDSDDGTAKIIASGGTTPYTYKWSTGAETEEISAAAGTYHATITDANNCTETITAVISAPEDFKLTNNGDFTICKGETANITITSSAGLAPIKYYWSTDGANFNLGESSLSEALTQTTTYTIYAEDQNNCISNKILSKVTINPEIVLGVNLEHNPCKGQCIGKAFLSITGGQEPFSFSWESENSILTDLCQGKYSVIVTDNFNCSESIDFTIKEPESNITVKTITTDAKCSDSADGTAKIIATGGTTPYTYKWSTGSENEEISAAAGTYHATITDANNCTETITAIISAPEKIEAMPLTDKTICINGSTTVSAQASGGESPYTFQWTGEDGSIYHSNEFTASPSSTTTYELMITDNNNCVNTDLKLKINVNPPLSISKFDSNFAAVCIGGEVIIDAQIEGGNGGPYKISTIYGETIKLPYTYKPKESGNFTIKVKDDCETPEISESIFIEVIPSPKVDFDSDIHKACPYTDIKFQTSASHNEIKSYYWTFGDHGFSEEPEPTKPFIKEGFYDVSLKVTDINGCSNTIKKLNYIEIYEKPTSIFIADPEQAVIKNPVIDFINKSIGATSYHWNFGDNSSVIGIKDPRHIYSNTGKYEVFLISENSFGCKDTTMRKVIIKDQLTLFAPNTFTPNDDGINDCFRVCATGINPETFNLIIYNRWGEKVFFTDKFFPDASCASCSLGSWDGTGNSKHDSNTKFPSGIYFWHAAFRDFNNVLHEYNGTVNLVR